MWGPQPDVKWGPAGVSANRSLLEKTAIAVPTDTITTLSASVRFSFHSLHVFCFAHLFHRWCLKIMRNFSIPCHWTDWHESFLGPLLQQLASKPCIVSLSGVYVFFYFQRLDCCNLIGVSLVHMIRHRQAQCTCEEVLLLCYFHWPAALSLPSNLANTFKKDTFVNPLHV